MKEKKNPLAKMTGNSLTQDVWKRLKRNKSAMIGLFILVALVVIALLIPFVCDYETDVIGVNVKERLQSPSREHLFGTDDTGRDIFWRVLYGSRYSLSIGIVAIAIALVFGIAFGSVAGFYGGKLEGVIMRAADILLAIPSMLLALVTVSALGANMFNLMLAVGLSNMPKFVRITRASVLTIRDREFVEAARAAGIPNSKIIVRHVIPNCLSPIIVQVTLSVGQAIISAAALSFLGMGIPSPAPEWGAMLSAGRKFIMGYSYMTLFPGLAIMITVLALNMLGDGLRDALDPKLKR